MSSHAGAGILSGLRVIDLSGALSGAVATQLLAEAGADVIKVEPLRGDPLRPTTAFATWNRSKRGITLDLATSHDQKALARLLAGADVLVHGCVPSRARRLGLDDESLGERFPQLVWCGLTGYPHGHADEERPGFDHLVQARSGLMGEVRGARDGPVLLRMTLPSWGAAYLAAIGVLARLVARQRTGRGGAAHTSLFQGALTMLTDRWMRAERRAAETRASVPAPLPPLRCSDGTWLHAERAPGAVPLVAETLAALDAPAGGESALAAAFARRPFEEWRAALAEAGIDAVPVARFGEILRDEQVRANDYVVSVEDSEWGRTLQAGPPFRTEPPSRVRGPAPWLGQHTDEVLAEVRPPPRPASGGHTLRHPLEDVRVLDLGESVRAGFATMILADLGADVVRLDTGKGDFTHAIGCQRGKRSLALDLDRPESRRVLNALVRRVDVVHHDRPASAARSLGVDYESLRHFAPEMIYCHTSAFGPRGAQADGARSDAGFQALSGWQQAGAGSGNPPLCLPMEVMSRQAAMASVVATLLGLFQRGLTGRGQALSASTLGAATLTVSEAMIFADGSIAPVQAVDSDQLGLAPGYAVYAASRGWLAVTAVRPDELRRLCEIVGVAETSALAGAFRQRRAEDWVEALSHAGLRVEEVRIQEGRRFFDRPEHRAAGLVASYRHRDLGQLEQIGAFWDFGDLSVFLDRAPPRRGEHTRELLRELDLEPSALQLPGVSSRPGKAAPDAVL